MPALSFSAILSSGVRRIGADLPDHEVSVLGLHVGLHAGDHLFGVLAAHALVPDMDGDARHRRLELHLELGRIGELRIGRAVALGRGRAEGNDAQLAIVGDGGAGDVQRIADIEQLAAGAALHLGIRRHCQTGHHQAGEDDKRALPHATNPLAGGPALNQLAP
jgi:hypothetical protein